MRVEEGRLIRISNLCMGLLLFVPVTAFAQTSAVNRPSQKLLPNPKEGRVTPLDGPGDRSMAATLPKPEHDSLIPTAMKAVRAESESVVEPHFNFRMNGKLELSRGEADALLIAGMILPRLTSLRIEIFDSSALIALARAYNGSKQVPSSDRERISD